MDSKDINFAVGPNEELVQLIDKLADTIGVATDTLFPWFVTQALIHATLNIIAPVLSLTGMILCCRYFSPRAEWKESHDPANKHAVGYLVCWAMSVVFIIWTVSSAIQYIPVFCVPEYYALKNLVAQLSSFR